MGSKLTKEKPNVSEKEDINDMHTQCILATKYLRNGNGQYLDRKYDALKLLELSANQGFTEAMYALGQIHRNGYYYVSGLTYGINTNKAYTWYERGYMNGHVKCTKELRSLRSTSESLHSPPLPPLAQHTI